MKRYVGHYIGQPIPAADSLQKVTGELQYADDLCFPSLLWGKVLTSPLAHARIADIDTREAEALPGVRAVITYRDAPGTRFNRIMRYTLDDIPATERALDDVVRFVGDEVAAVAADTEEIAARALKLIRVRYEELPAVFDAEQALRPDAPRVYPEGNLLNELCRECGSVEEALAGADAVVENVVSTPRIHHGAIEPHICVARWARGDELEVWEPQQGVFRVQVILSKLFGVPCNHVHVHGCPMGGSFGGKDGILLEPLALLLSKKAGGRYVKIRYNRTESMASSYTRHASKSYGKLALRADGTVTGLEIRSYLSAGPYCSASLSVQSAMCGKLFKIYRIPSLRYHGWAAYANTPVAGAMRGFGSPQLFVAVEHLMNKGARRLGMDPVEFRLNNLIEPHDADPATGEDLGSARIRDCLTQGAQRFGWAGRLKANRARNDGRYAYGCGVATALHGNGLAPFLPDMTVAELSLNEDGSALLRTGMDDHGSGTYTLLKQVVAETLDMPMEQVTLIHSDTDAGLYDMGANASRNTWTGAAAVEEVSRRMRATLLGVAGEMLGCGDGEVVMEAGRFRAGMGERQLTRSELVLYAFDRQRRRLVEVVSHASVHNAGSYGAHFAQVRVDKQTGEVKVTDYLAFCDVGTPLNPMLLEGQLQGAVLMGMGMALWEELVLDERGRPQNASFKKYRLPRASDFPRITVCFADNFEEGGAYGGKSIGEASVVPVAPAILGAVNDALQTDLGDLPLTPDKIKAALGAL